MDAIVYKEKFLRKPSRKKRLLRRGSLLLLCLFLICTIKASLAQPENKAQDDSSKAAPNKTLYRWKDEQGNWQFSGRPPENGGYEVISKTETTTTKWKESDPIKVTKAKPATKGAENFSKKEAVCQNLDKQIARYDEKIKIAKNTAKYRKLKREAQWRKLNEC